MGSGGVKHKWVMLATFHVTESKVAELAKARLTVSESLDAPVPRVDMELDQDRMQTLDGPGCAACGVEWTVGYGVDCPGKVQV